MPELGAFLEGAVRAATKVAVSGHGAKVMTHFGRSVFGHISQTPPVFVAYKIEEI